MNENKVKRNEKNIKDVTEDNNDPANVKKKGISKTLNTVINVVLIVAIVIAAVCTYVSFVSTSGNGVPNIFGLRLLSIQTDSMYPTLKPGDLIIDTGIKDPSKLRPKDIITYWTIINGEQVLNTHRIENIYDGGGYLIFETKGDNNTTADPLTVHESKLVGMYRFRIPGVGKVFDYLQTSTGFFIVVVIPVFIFFIFHLVQFFRVLFEYQNVKNRIKFEQERNKSDELLTKQKEDQEAKDQERARIEAELREKLRAEILESMGSKNDPSSGDEKAPNAEDDNKEEAPEAIEEKSSDNE